jgi:phosphopantetheinyl transferase (holo-ACP synthase)
MIAIVPSRTSPPPEGECVIKEAVGNDVVDLTDPAIADHHLRERFVSRVCATGERARVDSAFDLWALFAAKEAAYKALVKLGHSPGFGHREIRVAPDLRAVSWRGQDLELSVTADEHHVHAVAWSHRPEAPLARVARTVSPRGDGAFQPLFSREISAGKAARELLCELVAEATGCSMSELRVVRDAVPGAWDGFGPPRVEHRGNSMSGTDVSLSHDGPFAAAAAIVGGSLP